jgi:hypothetical protein
VDPKKALRMFLLPLPLLQSFLFIGFLTVLRRYHYHLSRKQKIRRRNH